MCNLTQMYRPKVLLFTKQNPEYSTILYNLTLSPGPLVSRIRQVPLYVNNFSKMRVNLAVNTLCQAVAVEKIKVITKLPNSEQSYKGKVQTHNYINRQNQSTTGKL